MAIIPPSRRTPPCYVNTVPATMVLRQPGSYYVVTRSLPRPLTATLLLRKFKTWSKFDHVLADLTTLLPRFHYTHPISTTLFMFPFRSHLIRERSKDVVETWSGVTGVSLRKRGSSDCRETQSTRQWAMVTIRIPKQP